MKYHKVHGYECNVITDRSFKRFIKVLRGAHAEQTETKLQQVLNLSLGVELRPPSSSMTVKRYNVVIAESEEQILDEVLGASHAMA